MRRHWPRGGEPALWPVAFWTTVIVRHTPNTRNAVCDACEATARRAQSGSSRLKYPSRAFSPARCPGHAINLWRLSLRAMPSGVPASVGLRAVECPVIMIHECACPVGLPVRCVRQPACLRPMSSGAGAARKVRSQLSASACLPVTLPMRGPPASHHTRCCTSTLLDSPCDRAACASQPVDRQDSSAARRCEAARRKGARRQRWR